VKAIVSLNGVNNQSLQIKSPFKTVTKNEHCSWSPSYLGGCDRDDLNLRPEQANSSKDPISKITRAKWTAGVAQAVPTL
jgi:hypothetical protein